MHEISMLHMQGREGFGSCRPGKGTKGDGCTNLRLSLVTPDGLRGAPSSEGEAKEAINPVFSPVPPQKTRLLRAPFSPHPFPSQPLGPGLALPVGPGWRRGSELQTFLRKCH